MPNLNVELTEQEWEQVSAAIDSHLNQEATDDMMALTCARERIHRNLTPTFAEAWVKEGIERGFLDIDRGIQFLTGEAGPNHEDFYQENLN
jgi:hypothetical protein